MAETEKRKERETVMFASCNTARLTNSRDLENCCGNSIQNSQTTQHEHAMYSGNISFTATILRCSPATKACLLWAAGL